MPELPEVQTVTDFIRPYLLNNRILSIRPLNNYTKVFATHSPSDLNILVAHQKIQRVWRRGKFIVFDLASGHLLLHLRMTGRIQPKVLPNDNPKHFTAQINLTNGTIIYFKDYRKFGRFYFYKSMDSIEEKLGPEPFSDLFTSQYLVDRLKTIKRMIKPLLLDQSFIAGIGNIYADEALWMSRIHPEKKSNEISYPKIKNLHSAIQSVLKRAIEYNGTTIINFTFGEESTGSYHEKLHAFGRQGRPCDRCQTNIRKIFVSQRGSHFCPRCQRK